MVVATVYSGGILSPGSGFLSPGAVQTADHVLLASGAGRLNNVLLHTGVFALSGVALAFYDSNTVALSGPATYAPTKRLLAVLNAPNNGASGAFTQQGIIPIDMPYNSGLCVCCASGIGGFSASFTPETNPAFG
jgi:hypothetical protein